MNTVNNKLGLSELQGMTFQTPQTPSRAPEINFLMGTKISFEWFEPYITPVRFGITSMIWLSVFMYILKHIRGFFT